MSSPTQSSEPQSPNAQTPGAPGASGARGGGANRPPPDVVGVDALKVYVEEFAPKLRSSCEETELDGVSTFLPTIIVNFVEQTLKNFNAKKLCVVFDGLFLPMSLKEKNITEDVVMAMASHFIKLEQEVMFAPYLASAQLEALKNENHVQSLYKFFPLRIPSEFIGWNDSDSGPRQANIYKYILNLVATPNPYAADQTVAALVPITRDQTPAANECIAKFIEKFSAVDEVNCPPLLFLLQSAGIISPRLSRALAHRVVENDGVNREDETQKALYEFMSVLLPLRAQIVHQLIANIPTYPDQNRIHLKWDENNFNTTPPIITLDNWAISHIIKGTNGPRSLDHLNFLEGWGITDVLRFENCAVSIEKYEEVTIHTIVPTVILRSLDLMGYFTHAQDEDPSLGESNCSIYGEALKQYSSFSHLGEAAVLFIELVRTNAFTTFKNVQLDALTAAAKEEGKEDPALAEDASPELQNERVAEDIATKIATLIPCATLLNPTKTAEKWNIQDNAQFIRAAQAHARSLRMLLEASAGNVILREFMNLAMYNPPDFVPHPFSLAGATDRLPSLAAAIPFSCAPPSARSFFMFSAIREFGCDAEKIATEFDAPKERVEQDIQNMKNFVEASLLARNHLSVRDDDVGLDPATLDVIEPALKILCKVTEVEYTEPAVVAEEQGEDQFNNGDFDNNGQFQ